MTKKRLSKKARAGLRKMAAYYLTCLDSWGNQFEDAPRSAEEADEINAALAWLNLSGIDYASLVSQEDED